MTHNQEIRRELQHQVQRKQYLEGLTAELEGQLQQLREKTKSLEAKKKAEQADVDKLEGRGLAALFYGMLGTKEEKLTQERREAYAAAAKYDMAVRELEAVEEDLRRSREELADLAEIPARWEQMKQEWVRQAKTAGGPAGQKLLELEERIAAAEGQRQEIREAVEAGQDALAMVSSILNSLESAAGWGTWDMVGGGLVASMAKHSALDEAQRKVETLQLALRRFKTELVDVNISADLRLTMDSFTRFADYFLDNFFVDWTVQNKITQAKEQVRLTEKQILEVLDQLNQLDLDQEDTIFQCRKETEDFLVSLEG